MIARHSLEQSGDGEGVEVVENKSCEDPQHGTGQYTEKRIHLSRYVEPYSSVGFILLMKFLRVTSAFLRIIFQSSSILDPGYDSKNILHHRKSLELLSVYHYRIHGKFFLLSIYGM